MDDSIWSAGDPCVVITLRVLSNMKIVPFENKKELFLGLRWRNVSGTKGSKGMLAVVKVKGMNGGGPRKQLNSTSLIPKV